MKPSPVTSSLRAPSPRRRYRRLTWTLVTLGTLFTLLYTWFNWTAARQWQTAQQTLRDNGETIIFSDLFPDPLPASENFCAIPLLHGIALDQVPGAEATTLDAPNALESLDLSRLEHASGGEATRPQLAAASLGTPTDLAAWARWLDGETADSADPAARVLAALAPLQPSFDELAAGLGRPHARWTPEWAERDLPALLVSLGLPHYSGSRRAAETLALRAIAAARSGDAATAHQSAGVVAKLTEACLNDPFLMGLLVGTAQASTLNRATWEICHTRTGTAADFAQLESALRQLDLRAAALRAWRGELAAQANTIQYLRAAPSQRADLLAMVGPEAGPSATTWQAILNRSIPRGFFDANAAAITKATWTYAILPLRDQGWLDVIRRAEEWELDSRPGQGFTRDRLYSLSTLMAPATHLAARQVAFGQVILDQALIACALERYFITTSSYPDSLAKLTLADGAPLPVDQISGRPMAYRTTEDGRYLLWSVGLDGKDDGGTRHPDSGSPAQTNLSAPTYTGDWIWDYPKP